MSRPATSPISARTGLLAAVTLAGCLAAGPTAVKEVLPYVRPDGQLAVEVAGTDFGPRVEDLRLAELEAIESQALWTQGPGRTRYASLPAITFYAINTHESLAVRLYRDDGAVDARAVRQLSHLFRDLATREDAPLVARTLQLLVRAATHFHATRVNVISGYRTGLGRGGVLQRREGYHAVGSAVDFAIPGVDAVEVAAYARTFAHVGVGYYPEQAFVHLDSREQTFFWENAGGTDRPGWDRPLDRREVPAREARWTPADDAPWDGSAPLRIVLEPRTHPGADINRERLQAARGMPIVRTRPRPPIRVFVGGT